MKTLAVILAISFCGSISFAKGDMKSASCLHKNGQRLTADKARKAEYVEFVANGKTHRRAAKSSGAKGQL